MNYRKILLTIFFSLILIITGFSQEKRLFQIDDIFRFTRITDPQVSPDGQWIAFTATIVNKEKNSSNSDIWIISSTGTDLRQLTNSPKADERPRWSPDGKYIAFQSARDGSPQIFLIPTNGGEAKKITSMPNGTSNHIWSPDGKSLIFLSYVYPDCYSGDWSKDKTCNERKEKEKSESKIQSRIIDQLMFRHWNVWLDEKRNHIFQTDLEGKNIKQISNGNFTIPPIALNGIEDLQISPDGKEIAFSTNMDKKLAESTNNDIYIVPLTGGEPKKISISNGADVSPRYSPDGKYIAYRSQKTYGYEADLWRILIYNRLNGETKVLTDEANFDNWVDDLVWNIDSKKIYFTAELKGNISIHTVDLNRNINTIVTGPFWNENLRISKNGNFLAFTRREISRPNEIYIFNLKTNKIKQVTDINKNFVNEVKLAKGEEFWFDGAEGKVHGWIIKPPDFDPSKKYPMLLIIHGGPQQMFGNAFRADWQVFPGAGYVVVFTNPEGSPGYGQKFVEAISKDWGGKCYISLMKAVDYVTSLGFIDTNRLYAYGGSFGGYMVNWILGNNDRFAALITHAGVYNLETMYGTTEELWFPEWEMGGTPWEYPELYLKWSPNYLAKNFKTPTLITHGELDFRVPIQQGMELFTALQRRGIPSRFLWFADEGHWILKPQNVELWYKTMLDWLNDWKK